MLLISITRLCTNTSEYLIFSLRGVRIKIEIFKLLDLHITEMKLFIARVKHLLLAHMGHFHCTIGVVKSSSFLRYVLDVCWIQYV